jgi:hypothetical protein
MELFHLSQGATLKRLLLRVAYAPALKRVIDHYFAHAGVALLPDKPHTVHHAGDCFDAGASNRRGNAIMISVA